MAKKDQIKPRQNSIKGSFTANSESITFTLKDGSLIAESSKGKVPISNIEVSTSYKRSKKDKVLNKIHSEFNTIDLNKALSTYDFLYAIDSNTKELDNNFITIGALIKGEFTRKDEKGYELNYKCLRILSSQNEHKFGRMEQYYWYEAIKMIQNDLILYRKPTIGLIVDCDLGNLNKYNNRQIPLYSDFYLPPNFYLIYASADVGKENLPNKMISFADKEANRYFTVNYLNLSS